MSSGSLLPSALLGETLNIFEKKKSYLNLPKALKDHLFGSSKLIFFFPEYKGESTDFFPHAWENF